LSSSSKNQRPFTHLPFVSVTDDLFIIIFRVFTVVKVAVVVFVGYDTVFWQTNINAEQTASIFLYPGNSLFITTVPDKFAWRLVCQRYSIESGL
jgi:hypothetical protein